MTEYSASQARPQRESGAKLLERCTEQVPTVSVLIPVHNEEAIMFAAIVELHEKLVRWNVPFEIVLAENGSRDRTREIAQSLAQRFPEVRLLSLPEPNYGQALRQAILNARGTFVLCDEIDLCDTLFHERALVHLRADAVDLVVGSKAMPGADDQRPFLRRSATRTIGWLLRVLLGFRGTDTHGLKAFRNDALCETARRCVVDKDLFASEFVIRAQREGKRTLEIPITLAEKRPPSIDLLRRVPRVLGDLCRLWVAVRLRRP